MLTIEVFLATMSTATVAATAMFLWILSEFRAIRNENRTESQKIREENKAELQQVREENKAELQQVREENKAELQKIREENKEEHRITREEIRTESRRILEAIYFHRHDPNTGEAVFYPPAPSTSAD